MGEGLAWPWETVGLASDHGGGEGLRLATMDPGSRPQRPKDGWAVKGVTWAMDWAITWAMTLAVTWAVTSVVTWAVIWAASVPWTAVIPGFPAVSWGLGRAGPRLREGGEIMMAALEGGVANRWLGSDLGCHGDDVTWAVTVMT